MSILPLVSHLLPDDDQQLLYNIHVEQGVALACVVDFSKTMTGDLHLIGIDESRTTPNDIITERVKASLLTRHLDGERFRMAALYKQMTVQESYYHELQVTRFL